MTSTQYSHSVQMATAIGLLPRELQPKQKTDENRCLELPGSAYRFLNNPDAASLEADGTTMEQCRALLGRGLDLDIANLRRLHPDGDRANFGANKALPKRENKFNTAGKQILLQVNQFKVTAWPQEPIAQYDIKVTHASGESDQLERIKSRTINDNLIIKCWESREFKRWRCSAPFDAQWIFDGKKIAWNRYFMKPNPRTGLTEYSFLVDLDAEAGQPTREGAENSFNITIKMTTKVHMEAIKAWLEQRMDFSNDVFCAINFLDHLLRQYPTSKNYTQVKRSFFEWNQAVAKHDLTKMWLDNHIELIKGVYASMRLCHKSEPHHTGLAVNLDVANGLFWPERGLLDLIKSFFNSDPALRNRDFNTIIVALRATYDREKKQWGPSQHFIDLRKFQKLRFTVNHRDHLLRPGEKRQIYTIKGFVFQDQHKNDRDISHSKNVWMNEWTSKKHNGKKFGKTSIFDFFKIEYGGLLNIWQFPLVESMKGGYFPVECCDILGKQRYPYKANPDQTAKMIKLCVERPAQRRAHIDHGLRMLNWPQDPWLNHFKVKIDHNLTMTKARLLEPPILQFKGKQIKPGFSGRWKLENTKFLKPNPEPLVSWGIVAMQACMKDDEVKQFGTALVNSYISHGGNVVTKSPPIIVQPGGQKWEDIPTFMQDARNQIGQKFRQAPQIMVVILATKTMGPWYDRLKKNLECRFGIVSQMVWAGQAKKMSSQYLSNVCMKFNAKLGGTTNGIAGDKKGPEGTNAWFKTPTMVLGADVSHPGFGAPQASMAALSMSADQGAMRYWAAGQTNGYRVEMIRSKNMESMLIPFFPAWIRDVGKGQGPKDIYYFRDGVSEGQYDQVIDLEVAPMKAAILKHYPTAKCKFTVIVCGKRHKIRFFPNPKDKNSADQNGNPHPGTLVERDVTHPFENDFYLNSHSAIQGTARPTHYHVIMDEIKPNVNDLHKMIYQHCYQFQRSTTPISIYPAVYYAHLAAARCRQHEDHPFSWIPRTGEKREEYKIDRDLREASTPTPGWPDMTAKEKEEDYERRQDERVIVYPALQLMGSGLNAQNPVEKSIQDRVTHSMWYI